MLQLQVILCILFKRGIFFIEFVVGRLNCSSDKTFVKNISLKIFFKFLTLQKNWSTIFQNNLHTVKSWKELWRDHAYFLDSVKRKNTKMFFNSTNLNTKIAVHVIKIIIIFQILRLPRSLNQILKCKQKLILWRNDGLLDLQNFHSIRVIGYQLNRQF